LKFGYQVLCPKCGLSGFATVRNVRSSYTPKRSKIINSLVSSLYVTNSRIQPRIDRFEYWSDGIIRRNSKNGKYIKEVKGSRKENVRYKVYTKTYSHLYIGHYDNHAYGLKKIDYDQGSLKSRPNGRKWRYVPKNSVISIPSTTEYVGFTITYEDLKKKLLS